MKPLPIEWLPEAVEDFEGLHHFLQSKSPDAASRAARVIREGARLLAESPEFGRPVGDEAKHRELFLPFGASSYVIRYRLESRRSPGPRTVAVVRIWHASEWRND